VARDEQGRKKYPLGDYGLSIVLALLFFGSWIAQFFVQMVHFGNEAREHGQSFSMSEYWPDFWRATLENWQSEFLQLLTFVLLTGYLIHRGSAESKDSDEEMQETLNRIEQRLESLERKSVPVS
jgi:hypothetical protein